MRTNRFKRSKANLNEIKTEEVWRLLSYVISDLVYCETQINQGKRVAPPQESLVDRRINKVKSELRDLYEVSGKKRVFVQKQIEMDIYLSQTIFNKLREPKLTFHIEYDDRSEGFFHFLMNAISLFSLFHWSVVNEAITELVVEKTKKSLIGRKKHIKASFEKFIDSKKTEASRAKLIMAVIGKSTKTILNHQKVDLENSFGEHYVRRSDVFKYILSKFSDLPLSQQKTIHADLSKAFEEDASQKLERFGHSNFILPRNYKGNFSYFNYKSPSKKSNDTTLELPSGSSKWSKKRDD